MRATRLFALVPALVAATAAFVHAEDSNRIAVSVKGSSSATADSVEVEFTISARAEESADAEKKYRHKLTSLMAALKEGKPAAKPAKKDKPVESGEKPAKPKKVNPDDDDEDAAPRKPAKKEKDDEEPADHAPAVVIPFEITERGLTFGVKTSKEDANPFKAMVRINGGPAPGADPPFVFSSKVVTTIKGLKKLDAKLVARRVAQLIDLGIDSGADGADSASAPAIAFKLDDLEGLRTKAYEDAMSKAKARCEKLAKLGGRNLGPVVSVREGAAGAKGMEDMQAVQMKAVQSMFGSGGAAGDAPAGGFEVSVEVDLAVEFELAK